MKTGGELYVRTKSDTAQQQTNKQAARSYVVYRVASRPGLIVGRSLSPSNRNNLSCERGNTAPNRKNKCVHSNQRGL